MLLLLPLAYALIWAAHLLTVAIESGAPEWLNLVAFVLAWDALKFGMLAIHTGIRAAVDMVRRLVRRAIHRAPALS